MATYSAGLVTATDPSDLASVHVAEIPDGTNGFVISSAKMYTLFKNVDGTIPSPGDKIIPGAGSPIAGNPLAFWSRLPWV